MLRMIKTAFMVSCLFLLLEGELAKMMPRISIHPACQFLLRFFLMKSPTLPDDAFDLRDPEDILLVSV